MGGSYEDILKEICRLTSGPVSAEVVAEDVEGMLREGRAFAKLARNIVVKVPMSEEGLEAISRFAEEGIQTNCTLIFTSNQGLLAAKAGASLISPFVGRLDDINQDGMIVIRELAEMFAIHEIDSQILAASIRHPLHVTQAALAGSHIATMPFKVLQQMVRHPLTDKGIVAFRQDWEKARAEAAARSPLPLRPSRRRPRLKPRTAASADERRQAGQGRQVAGSGSGSKAASASPKASGSTFARRPPPRAPGAPPRRPRLRRRRPSPRCSSKAAAAPAKSGGAPAKAAGAAAKSGSATAKAGGAGGKRRR